MKDKDAIKFQRELIVELEARVKEMEDAIREHRDLVYGDDVPDYKIEHAEHELHKLID